ncbi:hypothetical protein FQA39_LY08110 [Lamprigera yunnana]|nr:hypothetical protein FQA39_LY08110 [Lamprigera yunnana]
MHTSTVGNSISAHPLLPIANSTLSVGASKLSASLGSMDITVETPVSPTMKSASLPPATAISWNLAQDKQPTTLFAQTTTSPSPPLTTQSVSSVTSATTSPQHVPQEDQNQEFNNLPVAVLAAVHRDDTGTIRTHTITAQMPYSHRSEGTLDQPSPMLTINYPSQTQSQNGLDAQINLQYTYKSIAIPTKRKIWQRSASCRELYDYSFEESGQAKKKTTTGKNVTDKSYLNIEKRKLESPVTRYDEHHILYSGTHQNSLEIHQDIMISDQKIYSSSYPGTTSYSQDSVEDPGNYDLRDSQDDLSHDSYELIEKSDDDISVSMEYKAKKIKSLNARSCSLDSGNYLPSDVDSDPDNKLKSKSSSDLLQEIFILDDPRDYPREKIPRKSDGSYYKIIKLGSRASSLESRSDYYETKPAKGGRRSSREISFGSRTSSQESKSDDNRKQVRKNKSLENLEKKPEYVESGTSSLDSKSDYFDTISRFDESKFSHEYDRRIPFERNYGIQKQSCPNSKDELQSVPDNSVVKELSKIQTVSLQNVETDAHSNILDNYGEDATVPTSKGENGRIKSLKDTKIKSSKSTDSESNIFSFDEDRIQSMQEIDLNIRTNILSEKSYKKDAFKDIFVEIEPKRLEKTWDGMLLHQPIERTKSDPNSLARQRLNLSSRRHLLMHQKSIDLTPAESSDDDYLYRQIPSAPPITKYRGSHFEIPTAEFGHFDVLKREIEGQKTRFEVPKSQFEVLGAKTQSDLINLPPKNDIPYTLHKRHIMNGTASKEETLISRMNQTPVEPPLIIEELSVKPKSPAPVEAEPSSFLFTQNIDLSKVDPVTLEVDKSKSVQHMLSPKRDITRIDPVLLETLNSKLSQIESDSPTSSKTESLKPENKTKVLKILEDIKLEKIHSKVEQIAHKNIQTVSFEKPEIKVPTKPTKVKTDMKPKRGGKPRSQLNKKGTKNKTKIRITSFSSDDESLDSDDVFGSAEATPTKLEFSPPQTRKEMESILKYEAERKYLQYTMSSTEVEGSPPQSRKIDIPYDRTLDPNYQTELRRISERSISIPSSEDDLNIATAELQPVFSEIIQESLLPTVLEVDKEILDKPLEELKEEEEEENLEPVLEKAVMLQELPEELYNQDANEKALLQSDIEHDLKDLRVPSKTKLTEICSPSSRRKGQSPLLFAHARLNLSEGSAMTMLQKQQATESPIPGRRAKSLDTPVVSVNRLPPLNAFSSKDDTVEEEYPVTEEQSEAVKSDSHKVKIKEVAVKGDSGQKKPEVKLKPVLKTKPKLLEKEKDQIVPDVTSKKKVSKTAQSRDVKSRVVSTKQVHIKDPKLDKTKVSSKVPPKAPIRTSSMKTPAPTKLKLPIPKPEEDDKIINKQVSLQTQLTVEVSDGKEIKRAKSQEIEGNKKTLPKEKAKSLEKLEFKRAGSRERIKSQDDSDTDIAKRQEKQQMLYEIAIQQTKTVKSPVKDVLPVFPQVEESVRERHGKLEISINTIEQTNVSLEEAIIITKSPKRLDKKMDKKLTKSLELNLTDKSEDEDGAKVVQRLGKSLDLENGPCRESEITTTKQLLDDAGPKTEIVKAEVHNQPNEDDGLQKVTLEGTSLDIWLSMEDKAKLKAEALENIVVIKKSNDFFEQRSKPPDLSRIENKSSSDSQSLEKVSLGNSLDIKYIDSSGDSSHKSEKDIQLIENLQKASETVGKFIAKKMEYRRTKNKITPEATDASFVRITSEDESLTEVSDLKCELDAKLLAVSSSHKEALLKLSIERSRSEDTGSWITVECDEYIGVEESFDLEPVPLESPEKVIAQANTENVPMENEQLVTIQTNSIEEKFVDGEVITKSNENLNLLTTESRNSKVDLLKRSSDQSRSSDTTGSWTSGEKDISGGNLKETGDESSVSCTMGQAIGLSQTIEKFYTRDQLDKYSPELEVPRSPRSPRICVLGRAFTIDEESVINNCSEESSSEGANEIPPDITPIQEVEESKLIEQMDNESVKYKKSPYPFEEKWSSDSELGQLIHQKIAKKLSSADKSMSSLDDSYSDKRTKNGKIVDKRSLLCVERLSAESRSSLDTESSSGSLGIAVRKQKTGELPVQEASSTWRPFPLESSGSSSFEEGILPQDQELEREYFVSGFKVDTDVLPAKENGDLGNYSNFGYPCLITNNSNVGLDISSAEVLQNYNTTFLARTLSRISERSTNSEKSSLDEDSTKASTQLDSLNDESLASSDHQASISSDTPSNAHVSESEKKVPINGNSGFKHDSRQSDKPSSEQICQLNNLLLQRQISDDRRTSAEMAELSMDDIEIITSESGLRLKHQDSDDTVIDEEWMDPENMKMKKGSSSQESDEWPLPEIPNQGINKMFALHETGSSDASQITTQVFRPPHSEIPKVFGLRGSLKSQDSEPWPSPPSSIQEPIIIGNVETHYITPPEEPCKVLVDSNTVSTYDNDSYSDNENKTLDMDGDKSNTASDPTYENVATDQFEQISEAISENYSTGPSGIKIILENKTEGLSSSNSEEDLNISNLNDDVFVDIVEVSKNELRPPTVLRRSTNSDDSSHSGQKNDKGYSRKSSHSSYSEDECTSSKGTNLEDGTVRLALKPTKCTHSSHSEDTSIALSLSEWSNSTNTVKLQNLSTSNSGATKSSTSGLKSDDNSLADIAHSISEWSSSNSNTLKAHNSSLQFQKLSSSASTGDSSTLTEFVPTISDRSSSDTSKTLIPQQFFNVRQSVSRLGSSIDDLDIPYDQKNIKSPQNIPSEDVALLGSTRFTEKQKLFTKSTERPVLIPIQLLSDTEKSTESSSLEQKIDKHKILQKHQSARSMDRSVKVPLSKCSPYYSSSLSSESTPVTSLKSISVHKTATVPLTRSHKKPISKTLYQTKSPPSENESTSSMESPKNTPDSRDRRGYRRRRPVTQKKHKPDKEKGLKDEYYYVEHESEYNTYIHSHNIKDQYQYENILSDDNIMLQSVYSEAVEEGYFPDGDSQSGSDIFRMEREEELSDKYEVTEGFDLFSIPPPLIEDDFEEDRFPEI